jgi:hypothetical protein
MTKMPSAVGITFIVIALSGCSTREHAPKEHALTTCPIDGQPPQWRGRNNGNSCEFFHYSDLERKTHSWWADCELADKSLERK